MFGYLLLAAGAFGAYELFFKKKPVMAAQPNAEKARTAKEVTLAQSILAKFFSTASKDGVAARVYHSGQPVNYSPANITGTLDQPTRDALAVFQAWWDDNAPAPTIHVVDAQGNWNAYGALDDATVAALNAWTVKSQ
jgi:hypothetical protein